MTATQITGGTVKYTEPSNYQSGKAGCEATIHFSVAEGADMDQARLMGDLARTEAWRLATGSNILAAHRDAPLGAAAPTTVAPVTAPPAPPAASTEAGTMVFGNPSPIGLPALKRSEAPASAEVVIGGPPTVAAVSAPPSASSAPTAEVVIGGPPTQPISSPPTLTVVAGANGSATPASGLITDEALRDAVQHKLAKLDPGQGADAVTRQVGPVKVGQLLSEFVTPPAKVYALTQEQRVDFLAKLEAL